MADSPRVLLINSDADRLLETTALLEQTGIDVMAAWTFQQVHQAMADRPPEVIVIEPVLDGIDGFELCRAIRKVYKGQRIPILIASHKVRGERQRKKARDVGAYLFLERPAMDERLVEVISELLPPTDAVERPKDTTRRAGRIRFAGVAAVSVLLGAGLALWRLGSLPDGPKSGVVRRSPDEAPSSSATLSPAPAVASATKDDLPDLWPVPEDGAEALAARWDPLTAVALPAPIVPDVVAPPATIASDVVAPPMQIAPVESRAASTPSPSAPEAAADLLPRLPDIVPRLIAQTRVEPRYPPLARHMQASGTVVLRAMIGADGVPRTIEVVEESAPRMKFGEVAIRAVQKWHYEPALRGNEPVEWPVTVRFDFEP